MIIKFKIDCLSEYFILSPTIFNQKYITFKKVISWNPWSRFYNNIHFLSYCPALTNISVSAICVKQKVSHGSTCQSLKDRILNTLMLFISLLIPYFLSTVVWVMGRHKEEAGDCRRRRGAVVIVIRPAVTHYYCLVTREREGQQKQSAGRSKCGNSSVGMLW